MTTMTRIAAIDIKATSMTRIAAIDIKATSTPRTTGTHSLPLPCMLELIVLSSLQVMPLSGPIWHW